MGMKSMNEYLEILSGYIYDDDKVVTYKWLSKELEVHVNIAKQILWEFWQKHKNENNIECTVIIIGNLTSGGMRVEVVRETNLAKAKEKYSEIKSEHLYSIQKSLSDLELLASCGQGDVKFSAIKYKENIERTDEELFKLRWGLLMNYEEKTKNKNHDFKQPVTSIPNETNQGDHKHINKEKTGESSKSSYTKFYEKTTKKKKISDESSLNTKAEKIEKENTISTENSSNVNKVLSSTTKSKIINQKGQRNGLTNYFEKNTNPRKNVSPPSLNDTKKEDTISIEHRPDNQTVSLQGTSSKPEKNKRGTKRNRSKESKNSAPKRKRIFTKDTDSESENETDVIDTSSPELMSEPEVAFEEKAKSPSPPKVITKNGRARVLKLVDKTYEEDGFLVTKKVHEYQSCSEDEETPVTESIPAMKSKAAPIKKKQTTLTSFFSKS